MTHLLTWIAGTVVIWLAIVFTAALLMEAWDWFWRTLPVERDMDYPSNPSPRVRVVQTYEGDDLAAGITRARILALEYKAVVLVHSFVSVMVFPGDEANEIAAQWLATKRMLSALAEGVHLE